MIEINKLSDERVKEFKKLSYDNDNTIVVDSEKVVDKLLKSKIKIHKIFANKEFYNNYQGPLKSSQVSVDMQFVAKKEIMEKIVGYKLHKGVMARALRPKDIPIELLKGPIIILNGVTSPENVGSIIRSAAAFNVDSIIIDKKSVSPYVRRCIRVSMGHIFKMKVNHTLDLKESVHLLKKRGYEIIGTANLHNAVKLNDYNYKNSSAIIIGSEGYGIENEILNLCDQIIKIPISNLVSSLNAAVSCSIFLYEFFQQDPDKD